MRRFVMFDAAAPDWRVRDGRTARLRSDVTLAFLALLPGVLFVRQRGDVLAGGQERDAGTRRSTGAATSIARTAARALGTWVWRPDPAALDMQAVLPDPDALNAACHLELDRQGPVLLHIPAADGGRCCSISVLDAHLNNTAHLGPHWTGGGSSDVLLVPPGWTGERPEYVRLVRSPTASVRLVHRALVGFDEGDADRVRAWQAGVSVRPWHGPVPAGGDNLLHPAIATLEDPWEFLRIGGAHVARNPLPAQTAWVLEAVDLDGLMAARGEEWAEQAVWDGIEDAQAMIDASLATWPTSDGWRMPLPWTGRANSHLVENAALQLLRTGTSEPGDELCFVGSADAHGRPLDCSDGAVYEVAFSPRSLPPVSADGSWSLTVYGPDNRLVANSMDRHSIRPSRPGFTPREDGTVAAVLSSRMPEGVDEAEWLPAPEGPFQIGLRLYYPLPSAREAGWHPPAVRRIG